MSMLSAQIDELRAMAESVGLTMPQAATLMMEAADTIWELRSDVLRERGHVLDAEHEESMAWDRVHKAEAENAKLRERVDAAHMSRLLTENENEKLRELLLSYWKRVHSPAAPNVERDYLAEMRELGVVVDE